jgi:hypothetical protein
MSIVDTALTQCMLLLLRAIYKLSRTKILVFALEHNCHIPHFEHDQKMLYYAINCILIWQPDMS